MTSETTATLTALASSANLTDDQIVNAVETYIKQRTYHKRYNAQKNQLIRAFKASGLTVQKLQALTTKPSIVK